MSRGWFRSCWCCGKRKSPTEYRYVREQWQGRMDGYCKDCALSRCDAFPGECPNRGPAS